MKRQIRYIQRTKCSSDKRGSTLAEILVALGIMTFIFVFITSDLIQSSGAENFASDHTQSIIAANYLLGVVKGDGEFWNPDWASGPQTLGVLTQDPCGVDYPAYTDSISAPTWHPLCTSTFPELQGPGVHPQFMWNVQYQNGDQNIAQITVWVMTDEGNRADIYEIHATRMNTAPAPTWPGKLPPTPPPAGGSSSPCMTNCNTGGKTPPPTVTPKPKPSPTAKPSPTPTPSPSPKPSPKPTGIFE